MSELIFYLGFGLASVVVLLLWAQRNGRVALSKRESSLAEEALTTFQLGLPARALAERIFAGEDWDFVASQARPEAQQAFLQERKRMALAWLRQTRQQVGRLMRFHLRAVRRNARLAPAVELRLTAHYLVFLMVYQVLSSLIWLRGPFAIQGMVGFASDVAQDLTNLYGRMLVGLDAESLSRVATAWPRREEGT